MLCLTVVHACGACRICFLHFCLHFCVAWAAFLIPGSLHGGNCVGWGALKALYQEPALVSSIGFWFWCWCSWWWCLCFIGGGGSGVGSAVCVVGGGVDV